MAGKANLFSAKNKKAAGPVTLELFSALWCQSKRYHERDPAQFVPSSMVDGLAGKRRQTLARL
jgi:hypothetical protein